MPEKMPLAALAQYFADGGKYHELASTISDLPRKLGNEFCPYCLGTDGRKSLMSAVSPPPVEHDENEDFYKCSMCKTIFAKNLAELWSVTGDY